MHANIANISQDVTNIGQHIAVPTILDKIPLLM